MGFGRCVQWVCVRVGAIYWKGGRNGGAQLAHRVVMELTNDPRVQHKGYLVYTDNFYTSPALFKALVDCGFGACGTARRDRRNIPQVVSGATFEKGAVVSTREEGILSLKWRVKREVLMLNTFHDDSMVGKSRQSRRAVGGVETISKPRIIEEYNQFIRGIDKSKSSLFGNFNCRAAGKNVGSG